MDFGDPDLRDERIAHLVELLCRLSEYSDKKFYPKFFIIRTFSEKPGVMRLIH
jgi:hypothetical protein